MHAGSWLTLIATLWGAPSLAGSEAAPGIIHEPPACIARSTSGFPILSARIDPAAASGSVRIRVKDRNGNFYRLELVESGGAYEAVLPRPGPEIRELVYSLEVSDSAFRTTTSPEFRVPIVEERAACLGTVAAESAGPPGHLVSDDIAAPPLPPDFESPALAAGDSQKEEEEKEKKSKKRGGLLLALGAAAGAAAGLGILTGGDEDSTSPAEPPAPPPPPPLPPPIEPPAPSAVQACFELPSSELAGLPVRIDASCSSPRGSIAYAWRLGDGRSRDGRVINVVYNTPGLYTVELTVSRIEPLGNAGDVDRIEKPILIVATEAPPGPVPAAVADLALTKTGVLTSRIVDGVLEFHIAYTIEVRNLGPGLAKSIELGDALPIDLTPTSVAPSMGSCNVSARVVTCRLGTLSAAGIWTVRLDVDVRPGVPENTVVTNTATVEAAGSDPSPSNNQATEATVLRRPPPFTAAAGPAGSEIESSFVSTLSSSRTDGSTSGPVRTGESSADFVNDTASFHHRFRSRSSSGPLLVEALIQRASGELRWRFDFSSDPRFALGSIDVLEGTILGLESKAVTFRLSGQPGERIRFSYRIDP